MRTTFSLLPFATPALLAVLHACGGDPGAPEDPPAASATESEPAAPEDAPRAPEKVEKGPTSGEPTLGDDSKTRIPWHGGTLIAQVEGVVAQFAEVANAPTIDTSGGQEGAVPLPYASESTDIGESSSAAHTEHLDGRGGA